MFAFLPLGSGTSYSIPIELVYVVLILGGTYVPIVIIGKKLKKKISRLKAEIQEEQKQSRLRIIREEKERVKQRQTTQELFPGPWYDAFEQCANIDTSMREFWFDDWVQVNPPKALSIEAIRLFAQRIAHGGITHTPNWDRVLQKFKPYQIQTVAMSRVRILKCAGDINHTHIWKNFTGNSPHCRVCKCGRIEKLEPSGRGQWVCL